MLAGGLALALAGAGAAWTGLAAVPAAAATVHPAGTTVHPAAVTLIPVWSHALADAGHPIALSSPSVATLDSRGASVLVGDQSGHVYAFHLNGGSAVAGWPASTGGVAVDSTPSSSGGTVFVGVGNQTHPNNGGYEALAANGAARWFRTVPATPGSSAKSGVRASLAVGPLQGPGVVAGSMGQYEGAFGAATGAPLRGFPFFQADSDFSTPAVADLYGNGQTDVIEGGASTAGVAFGVTYQNGGHIRVLSPAGAQICELRPQPNQEVDSSPAVGQFLAGNAVGITAGTGNFFPNAADTNVLFGLNSRCGQVWADRLDGLTSSSPALVNALGNGHLQVAEGTDNQKGGGGIWLLNGPDGHVIWHKAAIGEVIGSITSADLGTGYQDLLVPTTIGLQILDGRTGATVATAERGILGLQNSPLVTDDANGTVGITIAGYSGSTAQTLVGEIFHFEVPGTHGSLVNEKGAWPMFHHDPQLTGDAGVPPPTVRVPCRPPSGRPQGYYMDASDGGIFAFGNLPFCGSTGNIVLNEPIVGMAATHDAGGYWLVASDGGIFAFGDARFFGSTGNVRLDKPIVGMAPTRDGKGYWLVASDGGIFAFGDARFLGSTGNVHLNRPIVGMAATPGGNGYWLVASDGGIFAFGGAHFFGSTGNVRLNRPIVGMASTSNGEGYWLVATDGGIFAYGNGHFFGSTGNIRLAKPIVGMAAFS